MQATNCTRYGCTIAGRAITYDRLIRHYVCNACGGKICHSFAGGDRVFCGECGGEDFVSQATYDRQVADAYEVLEGLPEALQALVAPERRMVQCQSATEAIAALFG